MKCFFQILFVLLNWFTNHLNAIPSFVKVVLPNYEFAILKTENIKEEITIEIGFQNFVRSGSEKKKFI